MTKIIISQYEIIELIKDFVLENYGEQLNISNREDIEFENGYSVFITSDDLVVKKKEN